LGRHDLIGGHLRRREGREQQGSGDSATAKRFHTTAQQLSGEERDDAAKGRSIATAEKVFLGG
jgi:hypothetical protein